MGKRAKMEAANMKTVSGQMAKLMEGAEGFVDAARKAGHDVTIDDVVMETVEGENGTTVVRMGFRKKD